MWSMPSRSSWGPNSKTQLNSDRAARRVQRGCRGESAEGLVVGTWRVRVDRRMEAGWEQGDMKAANDYRSCLRIKTLHP